MICLSCQHDNREGAKFCEACGSKLDLTCASCGAIVRSTARFCDNCGATLASSSPSAVPSLTFHVQGSTSAPPAPSPGQWTPPHLAARMRAVVLAEDERKTITALFADLKGSTALIEGLDPEEARAIIDPALQLMMDAVHRYDGYVAQALGDGIFALFGAPIAHEDHPQRALYAALRMQEDMRRYSDQVRLRHGTALALRVGVNTGEVVVRSIRKDDLHTDYVPVGHSTNLAARMEQMATPGSILTTEYTHKLTAGYFEVKALGAASIKGMVDPLPVYEVLGAGPLRTRMQVSARRGLTRFVGRQAELEQLQHALERAKTGHSQIVGTMGEPGLGKSRLLYEFKLLSHSSCLVLEAYSVSHGKASPYLPVIELLKSYFRIEPSDDERTRRQKVIGKVLELDRSLEDTLPYLYTVLGIEERPSPLQQMDPQIRRQRTFDAIKKLLLRESLNQPLILIFEDLHWIDSETQGFLDTLSKGVASAKILLLVNYRPEYHHEWGQKTYYTQLHLAPLSKAEAEEFLDALFGSSVGADLRVGPQELGAHTGAPLQTLRQLILEKTQGTPFFIEEIVQDLVERGVLVRDSVRADPGPALSLAKGVGPQAPGAPTGVPLQIPPTVQGVLAARIDRLAPEEKTLLQQLAVIGREFPLSLVRQVITQPEEELHRLLAALQHKEFLYEQPAFPEVEYIFKHALTQEVAYGSVLIERRKVLHEQTGQAIEQLYKENLDEHYSELAHHYHRSGNTEKAIEYLQKVGQQAVQRSAHAEAVSYLTTAVRLLRAMPETPARARRELRLLLALSVPLTSVRGYAEKEVKAIYDRAYLLCQQIGETPQLFLVLRGLRYFHLVGGNIPEAQALGEKLLQVAQRTQDSGFLLQAHFALGASLCLLGDFTLSRIHLEESLVLYDVSTYRSHSFLYGQDPGATALSYLSWALWFLGYPDQALKKMQEALSLAQELTHPYSQAFVLCCASMLHQYRQETQASHKQAERQIAIGNEQGFLYWLTLGNCYRRWALIEQGQEMDEVAQLREHMDAVRSTGTELFRPYLFTLLARALRKTRQIEEGLKVVAEGMIAGDKTGERFYEAELYRLKGELLLQKAEGDKA